MSDDTIPLEAVEFLRKSSDHDSQNRQEALDDLRFGYGDQWPAQMQNSRQLEARPWFTINQIDSYVRQICNEQRQQRPRIKVHGVNSASDANIAKIITGVFRHVQEQSNADSAYDTAFEFAVRMGWGYWRVTADYVDAKSMDQDIRIETIHNPFSVYFDPNSQMLDGSDAKGALITDMIPRDEFRRLYPDADDQQFGVRALGDSTSEWHTKDSVRVAEYYRLEARKATLVALSDGSTYWESELPSDEILRLAGVKVTGDRRSMRHHLQWFKVTATEVLEDRELPGRYIPVVPVYNANIYVDGRIKRFGVIRAAKDPQRLLNYETTAYIESVAMAPKAKFMMAEGQDEGHEQEWASANVKAFPLLRYRQRDIEGNPAQPPIPVPPPAVPEGIMQGIEMAHQNLQRVMGMFDPAMRVSGNVSGKALQAEQQQSDQSQYHVYDNMTLSMKHTGRIMLEWLPTYYSEQRVMRIIGDDGKPDQITINDRTSVGKIENDLTVGKYDVVMETGPGYDSKRQEAYEMLSDLAKAYPPLMQVAGDLILRYSDVPGADIIADRLAASNPLAQIDDKSEIPPYAQMMIKNLQQQLQQSQQTIQQAGMAMKYRQDIEGAKQQGETQRLQIKEAAETQRRQMEDATKRADMHTKAFTSLSVAELQGVIDILTQAKDHRHERELAMFESAANREENELDREHQGRMANATASE